MGTRSRVHTPRNLENKTRKDVQDAKYPPDQGVRRFGHSNGNVSLRGGAADYGSGRAGDAARGGIGRLRAGQPARRAPGATADAHAHTVCGSGRSAATELRRSVPRRPAAAGASGHPAANARADCPVARAHAHPGAAGRHPDGGHRNDGARRVDESSARPAERDRRGGERQRHSHPAGAGPAGTGAHDRRSAPLRHGLTTAGHPGAGGGRTLCHRRR
jgi:hypothetical protein